MQTSNVTRTTPGIGPGSWRKASLAEAQESHARLQMTTFRLYTECIPDFDYSDVIARYFDGATVYQATGLYAGQTEPSTVIEISAGLHALQRVFDLAGDIKVLCNQSCVLVTWAKTSSFMVTDRAINNAQAAR